MYILNDFKTFLDMGVGLCSKLMIGSGLYGYVCNLSIHHYGGGLRRLHNPGAGAFGARPTIVESIMVDGKIANIAIQPTPNH